MTGPKDPKDRPGSTHMNCTLQDTRSGPSGPSLPTGPWGPPARGSFSADSLPGGLASHQLEALCWLRPRPVALLADATGSGKTAVAAACIGIALDEEGARRGLWVTEANLVGQAVRELKRFLPGRQTSRWPGGPSDVLRVVSVETLTRHLAAVLEWAPDVAVVDEASGVKGSGPEPEAVAAVLKGTRRSLGLTATPLELEATEAYRILRLLGARGLPPAHVFDRFIEWQDLPYGETRAFGTRADCLSQVRATFARHILRRDASQLGLVLPDLEAETFWVRLTPPQQTAYTRAAQGRTPLEVASRRERACAYAGGRSAKAEAAVAWLESNPAVPKVLVFAENYRHLDIAERLLDAANIGWRRIDGSRSRRERDQVLDDFARQAGVRVLLGTRVLERGLDGLQHCGVLLTLGASFNPAREEQRIGRLRRPGSPHAAVRHLTFATDTDHERGKAATLGRRYAEARALIHGLTGESNEGDEDMQLTREQVKQLEANRRWLPERTSAYGADVHTAVAAAPEGEFLQAAIRSGHLPDITELAMGLEGWYLLAEGEVRAEVARGRLDFAGAWVRTAADYRRLARMLREEADRLEELGSHFGIAG